MGWFTFLAGRCVSGWGYAVAAQTDTLPDDGLVSIEHVLTKVLRGESLDEDDQDDDLDD